MKRILFFLSVTLLLAGCGGGTGTETGGGAPAFQIKADGKESTLDIKSGVMQTYEQTHSNPKYAAAIYGFTLASYDIKTNGDLSRTLTKPEEKRVYFKIYGDQGTNKTTPIKPGTFKSESVDFPIYDTSSLAIMWVADGQQKVALSQNSPGNATKGEVKITSVEGDTVKGEINVTTGETIAARGSFTAKIKPTNF